MMCFDSDPFYGKATVTVVACMCLLCSSIFFFYNVNIIFFQENLKSATKKLSMKDTLCLTENIALVNTKNKNIFENFPGDLYRSFKLITILLNLYSFQLVKIVFSLVYRIKHISVHHMIPIFSPCVLA